MLDMDGAIRLRAYEFWQAEGEIPNRDLEHWLKAEAEIKALLVPVARKSAVAKPAVSRKAKPASRAKVKA
jgi:hypothetical protein